MAVVASGVSDLSKAIILWDNVLNSATITSAGTNPAYPAINAAKDPNTWSAWRGASGVATSMTADIPAGMGRRTNNCLGVANHNLATSGASVSLQYSDDGSSWSLATAIYAPLSDEDFMLYFPTITARYWRVNVLGNVASIGVVFLGNVLIMPSAPLDDYTPLHHARQYTKMFNDSIKGQFLGNRVMAAGAETDVDFGFVTRDFVDGPLRGFEDHYNRGGTFFYASWPGGKPQDMGYCRAKGEDETISIQYVEADRLANLSFGVRSFVGA